MLLYCHTGMTPDYLTAVNFCNNLLFVDFARNATTMHANILVDLKPKYLVYIAWESGSFCMLVYVSVAAGL